MQPTPFRLELPELLALLEKCAGRPLPGFENRELTTSFDDLGYDSLALLECAARLQSEHHIAIPDEELMTSTTPEAMLALVNGVNSARVG